MHEDNIEVESAVQGHENESKSDLRMRTQLDQPLRFFHETGHMCVTIHQALPAGTRFLCMQPNQVHIPFMLRWRMYRPGRRQEADVL